MPTFNNLNAEEFLKHCGKRRKCWKPAFSPIPTMFSILSGANIVIWDTFTLLSASAFNSRQSVMLTHGKRLNQKLVERLSGYQFLTYKQFFFLVPIIAWYLSRCKRITYMPLYYQTIWRNHIHMTTRNQPRCYSFMGRNESIIYQNTCAVSRHRSWIKSPINKLKHTLWNRDLMHLTTVLNNVSLPGLYRLTWAKTCRQLKFFCILRIILPRETVSCLTNTFYGSILKQCLAWFNSSQRCIKSLFSKAHLIQLNLC